MFRPLLLRRFVSRIRPALEALIFGLVIGFADSNHAGHQEYTLPAFIMAGAILGLRHAGRAMPCWPTLGASLYVVHVIAIACGKKPPYVEENYRFAESCLWVIAPTGLSVMAGAGFRLLLSSCGLYTRSNGPPVRFLPKSTRDIIIMVACLGIGLGCLRQVFFPPTVYAKGFNEARFQSIRVGMKPEQVISVLGEPLEKQSWQEGFTTWKYSDQYTYTSDFERRWIMFSDGVVQTIVNDYWYD